MDQEEFVNLMKQLERYEPFQVWRDQVAKPVIEQIEGELLKADELPEAVVRGNLKYLTLVKALFYRLFEDNRFLLEDEKERRSTH